jgi:type IVB pilus formation R64 PilN family outer membrane protein
MMLKKWLNHFTALLLTVVFLAACNQPIYMQTEDNLANVKLKAAASRARGDANAQVRPALVIRNGLYVDTTPISLQRNPSWLKNFIVIRGDQLPFSFYSRTIATGAGSHVLTKFQVGLDPSINVTLNYSGTVKGALDMMAAKTGYVYSIHRNVIYWQAFVTKTFDVAFMPGGTDYLMGKTASGSSGQSGPSGASASGSAGAVANYTTSDDSDAEYSNLKGTLSIWKDLNTTIREMLSPDGRVMVSESTTTVTVRDRPSNVALVGQYIDNLNHHLSKQVLVKVQVLDVTLENDFNWGINWGALINAFNKSPFQLNANYGTPISITSITGLTGAAATLGTNAAIGINPNSVPGGQTQAVSPGIPSYTILFNALNQQGKTSLVSEPRVVCLNNQVSAIRIVKSQGYLASVQNTSLAGGGNTGTAATVTSQLTPGQVTTGLTLYILPKIMKDKIYLQVNADLSAAGSFQFIGTTGPLPATGAPPNSTFIQVPNISIKHFNQRSMIRSGDTLILSGLRQVGNTTGAEQLFRSQSLGGKSAQQTNIETIVLITPFILPGSV